jgi:thiamine pyrophosphokinase
MYLLRGISMNNYLVLPQIEGFFDKELPAVRVMLVAGGREPDEIWLKSCLLGYHLWCVDRGIEVCRRNNIIPDRLIGDGDSASSASWNWALEKGIPTQKYPRDKDYTDLQLALQTIGNHYGEAMVVVTGGWGGRFDHAFSNAMSLIWSNQWGIKSAVMADESEVMILLQGSATFTVTKCDWPQTVSLIPLSDRCSGVTSNGVHWPLHQASLVQHQPDAICNRLEVGQTFTVSIESGWLGIYFYWHK